MCVTAGSQVWDPPSCFACRDKSCADSKSTSLQHLLGVSLTDHVTDLQDGFPVCFQEELARSLICKEETHQAALGSSTDFSAAP